MKVSPCLSRKNRLRGYVIISMLSIAAAHPVSRMHGQEKTDSAYHAFTQGIRDYSWPVVHHSADYSRARNPAYRVVHSTVLPKLMRLCGKEEMMRR